MAITVQEPPTQPADCRAVAVVDDDPDVRESLSVLLEVHGIPVRTYDSGDELLADSRRRCARCFVVDQHMPGVDGIDVLSRLRDEGIVAPAILITGRLDPKIAGRGSELGVTAILEKPFATGVLLDLLRDNFLTAR